MSHIAFSCDVSLVSFNLEHPAFMTLTLFCSFYRLSPKPPQDQIQLLHFSLEYYINDISFPVYHIRRNLVGFSIFFFFPSGIQNFLYFVEVGAGTDQEAFQNLTYI